MLEILRIRNIAIIDFAEIHFRRGLNILSGETGAGKSIVLEAISLLLGSRASVELIRSGCEEAVIEGFFQTSDTPWVLERLKNAGFEDQTSDLLIKRTVHRAGKHRISINGELATLSVLQNICEGLIDLCGQHEHQSLLKSPTQLELVDRFGGLSEKTKSLSILWSHVRGLRKEQELLQKENHDRNRKADFLKFQIDEIENSQLMAGEEEALQQEKQLLQSGEVRVQIANSAREVLEAEDQGAIHTLRTSLQKTRNLAHLDERVKSYVEGLERAVAEVEEVAMCFNRYLNSVDLDPERLQTVQERLVLISDLKRKYGSTIPIILETLVQLQNEYHSLDLVTERLNQIENELKVAEIQLKKAGSILSVRRRKASDLLATSVTAEIQDLKMGEAQFLIDLILKDSISEWNSTGGDAIQFLVQTNRGEPARSLNKIASGGELSRLMLAIRRVISDRGGIGVYLFDEIDAGIGGQTAFQVGKKLKSVAKFNQVICITHLPQVASFADHHLVVIKFVQETRTRTEIKELSYQERREELARMLGGPVLTNKSLENAAELIELAGA